MDAVAVGNFDVASQNKDIYFSHTGTWYEYFTGQSFTVNNTTTSIALDAGDYRLYTDVNIGTGTSSFNLDERFNESIMVYPNPSTSCINVRLTSNENSQVTIYNSSGQLIQTLHVNGIQEICGLPPGHYILNATSKEQNIRTTFVITQ
jgi:hypothetical protein